MEAISKLVSKKNEEIQFVVFSQFNNVTAISKLIQKYGSYFKNSKANSKQNEEIKFGVFS